MVARGVTHVFQIVVLTARPQTGLHRSGTHVGTFIRSQKYVLELHHAGIGEHQSRIVTGYERAAGHDGMVFGGKKVEKGFANIGNTKHGLGHS